MATPVRTRRTKVQHSLDPITPAKLELPIKTDPCVDAKSTITPGMKTSFTTKNSSLAKTILASLAGLDTPIKADLSPASAKTPISKKQKSPEKKKADSRASTPVKSREPTPISTVHLPPHYQRLVNDLRILDETLSIIRVKNQIPFFTFIRENIERVSGRRFSVDHFRQLVTATEGKLYKVEWQEMKDIEGKSMRIELTIRATDEDGTEIFKRMTTEQSASRNQRLVDFLSNKLIEYITASPSNKPENSYPIKPAQLPEKPTGVTSGEEAASSGRSRILAKCDSVASNGDAIQTPKSSLRRQLSISASPIIPNTMPQFLSTPVKLPPCAGSTTPGAVKTPMSAKERLDAIRNRVKAREAVDVEEAQKYDKEMEIREKLDEFDLSIKLLIKLNHKFPRGITTAKLSTITKDFGSMFVNPSDTEKWCNKICNLVPANFQTEKIGNEIVLIFKTPNVKFSAIKANIEQLKKAFQNDTKTAASVELTTPPSTPPMTAGTPPRKLADTSPTTPRISARE